MTDGIKIAFNTDENGSDIATVLKPENKIPVCLGNNRCKHFIEKPIKLGKGLEYNEWHCKLRAKSVFEILDSEQKCPLNFWYVGYAYLGRPDKNDNTKNGEDEHVETAMDGHGNNWNKPKGKRNSTSSWNHRNKRKKRKEVRFPMSSSQGR